MAWESIRTENRWGGQGLLSMRGSVRVLALEMRYSESSLGEQSCHKQMLCGVCSRPSTPSEVLSAH